MQAGVQEAKKSVMKHWSLQMSRTIVIYMYEKTTEAGHGLSSAAATARHFKAEQRCFAR
jgi:hypothetical protein